MAFKLKPPYKIDNTPVYYVKEEDGVLGRAQLCGSITINDKVRDPKQINTLKILKMDYYGTMIKTFITELVKTNHLKSILRNTVKHLHGRKKLIKTKNKNYAR